MRKAGFRWAFAILGLSCSGCGEDMVTGAGGAGGRTSSGPGAGGMAGEGGMSGGMSGTDGGGAGGSTYHYLCDMARPPGAPEPDPVPPYNGTCPMLADSNGQDLTLVSSGSQRRFILVVPQGLQTTEHPALAFMWHPLGTTANIYLSAGELREAVDQLRFIAVLPEAKGDLLFKFPSNVTDSDARINEEVRFFDDLYACVYHQYPNMNRDCVISGGASTGALWGDQLAARRSKLLSSFISLSGGVGASGIRPWPTPERKLPGWVLWGGPSDNCFGVFSFQTLSRNLESALTRNGDFVLECIHNCGHALPPFPEMPGVSAFMPLWDFALNHPYWLPPGTSPYQQTGLPTFFPPWCGIGAHSATPRTGMCDRRSAC
jgi:hypothetical protein